MQSHIRAKQKQDEIKHGLYHAKPTRAQGSLKSS